MKIRIAVFLGLTSVAAITNTLLIAFAYKALAGVTSKLTETVAGFEKSSETRQWIDALRIAAERAVAVTQSAKQSIAEFDPVLDRAREDYNRALVKADSKLEQVAHGINTTASMMKDVVAKPAFSTMAFAAAVSKIFENTEEEL